MPMFYFSLTVHWTPPLPHLIPSRSVGEYDLRDSLSVQLQLCFLAVACLSVISPTPSSILASLPSYLTLVHLICHYNVAPTTILCRLRRLHPSSKSNFSTQGFQGLGRHWPSFGPCASERQPALSVRPTMPTTCRTTEPGASNPYHRVIIFLSNSASPASSPTAVKDTSTASIPSSRPFTQSSDPYHGHEEMSVLCAHFVSRRHSSKNSHQGLNLDLDHVSLPVSQHAHHKAPDQRNTDSGPLRRLRITSGPPPVHRHACRPGATTAIEDKIPCRPRFIGPPTLPFGLHYRLEGHLR
jgi:hypothetical protein